MIIKRMHKNINYKLLQVVCNGSEKHILYYNDYEIEPCDDKIYIDYNLNGISILAEIETILLKDNSIVLYAKDQTMPLEIGLERRKNND